MDWNQIPDTRGKIIRYALLALLALVLICSCIWGYNTLGSKPTPIVDPAPAATSVDSTALKEKEKKMKEEEQQKMDSIKKHVQDSLNQVRQKKVSGKAQNDKKKSGAKKNEAPKKEEPKQRRFH